MSLRAYLLIAALAACGGQVADAAHNAGTDAPPDAAPHAPRDAASHAPLRCLPDDPQIPTTCPPDTLCSYAWGNGTSVIVCATFPAECATERTCECLLTHPPAPPNGTFCGGRYCDVTDAGAMVITCAPD